VYKIVIDKFLGKSHTEDQEAAGSVTLMRILREKVYEDGSWMYVA